MTENCFTKLLKHGQKFDEGVKKLTETWRYPQRILGGYGADLKAAEASLKILKDDLSQFQKNINNDAELRKSYMSEMETFLEESQHVYEDIVQSCNDMETVLSEYGYENPQDESVEQSESDSVVDTSLIPSDVTDDLLEVEFTPNMTWRQKPKTMGMP
ncbi:uncharacterized protein [Neodiprion pinetum]|uniref:uncharacterized protein isoform X1 n=1 Tax=Neodiprion pinetum TaxID=441929 RepID=UPI001EDEBAAC|nr:uncharacterized protein LOC124211784 isoform X1 [Neodiprion pinetum]